MTGMTVFPDLTGGMCAFYEVDLLQLVITPKEADSKVDLPLLKLARFGDMATDKGSLRHDANVVEVTGGEIDYDGEVHGIDYAAQKLREAGIHALLYTSPSHTEDSPRWRCLLPFATPFKGDTAAMRSYRAEAVRQAQDALGFEVASESYTLSQSFYFGKVCGGAYRPVEVPGKCIDQLYDLSRSPPAPNSAPVNGANSGWNMQHSSGVDVAAAVKQVLNGELLHEPLRSLSSSYAAKGMRKADIIATLRAHLDVSSAKGTERWQDRYDDLPRLVASAMTKFGTPIADHAAGNPAVSLGDALRGLCKVTKEDVRNIKEATHVYHKVFPRGQLIALVGEPNSGKTTVMEYVCSCIEGEVLYINMDISGAHIAQAELLAEAGGYDLMCPDIKPGVSIENVAEQLGKAARSAQDLSNTTIIIDTLKKLARIMSKEKAAEMYRMLRALTGRGATVICLAHTNKYKVEDNGDKWPIYEGVGDLRSDFDALVLLEAHIGDYGLITTSLYWREQGWPFAKDRGLVEPQSWTIDKHDNRKVTELDWWIDTHQLNKDAAAVIKVGDLLQDVHSLLNARPEGLNLTQIVDHFKDRHSARQLRQHVPQHVGRAWNASKGRHNADVYTAIKGFRTW